MGRAGAPHGLDEARRRVDLAGGADRDEQVAGAERGLDRLEPERHLAEPDDVRSQAAARPAAGAGIRAGQIAPPWQNRGAGRATHLEQLAVHVDQPAAAGALVEVVDVLGHHQDLARPHPLEAREREVRGIGADRRRQQLAPPLVVEALHQPRLARERLGRRDLLEPSALPQPVGAAKARQSGFDGDPRSG